MSRGMKGGKQVFQLNPVGFKDSIDEVPWHFCLNGK